VSGYKIRSVTDDSAAADAPEASLLGLVNVLLRRRWLVVLPALLAFGAVVAVTLFEARTYTASTTFLPQVRRSAGQLSGLAAQFGVGLPSNDPMQSPQFYADLVSSREILQGVADTRYRFPTDTGEVEGTLYELYQPEGETPERRRDALLEELRDQVKASPTEQTGVVHVAVATQYRQLSPRIAERILDLVNAFNLQTRQSQARAERRFVEQRLAEVRSELREAENQLQAFLQRNREFASSSALAFERQRREREVDTYRSLYTDLAQNFEQARMDEVRDTPVITVLEQPEAPSLPDPRHLIRKGMLALLGGAVVGVFLSFAAAYLERLRESDVEEYEQFRRLRAASFGDFLHPWRAAARLVRRRSRDS
jgi:uncharacterized protein involved in exopolysaccharide biosynthesis